ncbi:MAG TPA: methyltransferase domain-containing protein [Terriglobales bacterium]|jgi:ubiquinone/menaquinone biosynthesis C-methylase UbiE
MNRLPTAELLDSDAGSPAEVSTALADLRRINRWFGGVATTRTMLERVIEQLDAPSLSLLEVAAGSGDVPLQVRESLKQRGVRLDVTLLDRTASHLRNGNATRAMVADALNLPIGGSSFDLVSSALFVHHLPPDQMVQFVNEALRVCRIAVLINDLIRHPLHLALVYAGMPLYRGRLTRHDAPASVRQAYTPAEMRTVLKQTSASRIEIHRHYLFRMGVIAWKV